MPLTGTVSLLTRDGTATAGAFLAGSSASSLDPADLLAVAVGSGGEVAPDAVLDSALTVPAAEIVRSAQLTGKAGQVCHATARAGQGTVRIAFVGVADRSATALRRAGAEISRLLRPGETAVTSAVTGQGADQVRAFAEGVLLGSYRFSQKSAAAAGEPASTHVLLLAAADPDQAALTQAQAAVGQAAIFASAVALTRDLANTPSVSKCPQWLADAATDVAGQAGLAVRVWTEEDLASNGFGCILAVGSGSARGPRLIQLEYAPPDAQRHVVLVGKGITFDSGGLSLKPNDGMKAMKTDMAGGGAVIAVMSALASLGVRARVTGLVAAAENMPSGSAYRPGDVLTCYGGRTVEVLNTDAEGRLVLADALAYAVACLAPDQIIDVATLTGAVRVALGSSRAALYSTSEELAAGLLEAGESSGDRLWRMPLTEEYRPGLDSPVADLANISRADNGAGSVTAALFLREFSGSVPWAHLDIAGAGRSGSDDGELAAGATGFGTRLLLAWLAAS